MGLNFLSMVGQLTANERPSLQKMKKTVSRQEYEVFCNEFIFESLKGLTFGQAFCERFDITDNMLSTISDDSAKFLIEKLGYIK